MLISDRSKEIIENLMNANGPLTVSALSKKLGVTERNIYLFQIRQFEMIISL